MTLASELDAVHSVIHRSFLAGEIGEDSYFHGIISIAYGMVQMGATRDATQLVTKISDRYLQMVLPVEMEEDPAFFEAATKLAAALHAAGEAVPAEDEIPLTVVASRRPA